MNRFAGVLVFFFLSVVVNATDFLFSPVNVSDGLSDNQIRYIFQLPDGRMIFTTSGNLNLYDGAGFKYIHRTVDNIYPLTNYDGYYRIYQSDDSLLWIKDTHKLMCVNLIHEKYIRNLVAYFKTRGIDENVEDIFVDNEHQLWLLMPNGLRQCQSSEIIDLSVFRGNLQDLATCNNKLYLFYSTGHVVCYDLATKQLLFNKEAYPAADEAKFKNTSMVVMGHHGIYQLRNGTAGGFFFFDTQNNTWDKILETNYTLNTLFMAQNDIAYISCTTGIWIIDHKTGKKHYLPELKTANGTVIHTEISTLFFDRQGGFWLGTLNQGLFYDHPFRYKFKYMGRSYFPRSISTDFIVQAFTEDSLGRIYIKTQSEYYQMYSVKNDSNAIIAIAPSALPKAILAKLNQKAALLHQGNLYTDSITDFRGWKWRATTDGLLLSKPGQQNEHVFYTENGLSNNSIHAILEDRNRNLWITTSFGISKVEVDSVTQTIRFVNFNPLDGTLDGEYANGAVYESMDGTLYFGGVNGFNILRSNAIPSSTWPFKPVFVNLFLRGEKIEIGQKYDQRIILQQAGPYTANLDLSYNQNFLTFEFSALNYLNPHQTRYRYQLKGIDADWTEAGSGSEHFGSKGNLKVSYTNLPPGKYTLTVMASVANNRWEGESTQIRIEIHPPWWKTNIAYFLYFIGVLLIVSFSVYLYIYFTRIKLDRIHREEILLLRIRNLIEQQKQLETDPALLEINENHSDNRTQLPSATSEFISRAIALVEKNLDEPNYSVEQLSADLFMDRTGLYRKLKNELDKSPSLFIRNIRLQRAAQLILDNEYSISEIAEKVGFSSSSYLSKCFQEMYGCRPSEYAENLKKST